MISDLKKARPNNGILVSRDWNCNKIIIDNISVHAPH